MITKKCKFFNLIHKVCLTQPHLVIIRSPPTVTTTLAFTSSDPWKASSTTSMQPRSSWLRVPLLGMGVSPVDKQSTLGSHALRFTCHKMLRRSAALSGIEEALTSFCQNKKIRVVQERTGSLKVEVLLQYTTADENVVNRTFYNTHIAPRGSPCMAVGCAMDSHEMRREGVVGVRCQGVVQLGSMRLEEFVLPV